MEVNENAWKFDTDQQCNRTKETFCTHEKVGQNGSVCFHQVLDVGWPRISCREILWDNSEQSKEDNYS
jgi:hypothetical protein